MKPLIFIEKKALLLIILIGVMLYLPSLKNDFVIDDYMQVVNNSMVHSISNIPHLLRNGSFDNGGNLVGIYYRPLMSSTFALLYNFFGPNPLIYHLLSLVLHILNTILVFLIFRFFLSRSISLLLAMVFLVHPINSEVVLYISDLQDVIFLFFGMLALWIAKIKFSKPSIILLNIFLFLSFLSKETGMVFIPLVLLLKYHFDKKSLPILTVCVTVVLSFYLFLRFSAVGFPLVSSPIAKLSTVERLLNIPAIIFFYIKTFIFPSKLAFSWNWAIKTVDLNNFWVPVFVDLLFVITLFKLGSVLRNKSTETFRGFSFFLIWLAISLGLHIQIFPLELTVSERWFYMPIVGLLGILGVVLETFISKHWSKQVGAIGIIILLVLSIRTYYREKDWKDEYTLAKHDATVSDADFVIEDTLANNLYRQKKFKEAKVHAQKSVDLFPYPTNLNNLAAIYLADGQEDKAREFYLKSMSMGDYHLAYESFSFLLLASGEYREAELFIGEKALNKFPNNPMLWLYRSLVEYKLNKHSSAKFSIERAYSLDPTNPQIVGVRLALQNNQPIKLNFDF